MLALSQLTVKNVLVQRIRDEIIRGHFSPGERLPLRDLAKQFNVSTQPIRQALSELEAEGLVKSEARKGAFVTSLTPAELDDIYEIRATLEAMATKVAVSHLTDGTLDRLDQLIVEIDRSMAVLAPDKIIKSIIPVVMAGILGIYGVIVGVLLNLGIKEQMTFQEGYKFLGAGLCCGLSSLAAGIAIGIVGDAGVRANAQQEAVFIGMILILIFAEAVALYGFIISLVVSNK